MRKFLIHILYKLLEYIEKYEYRKLDLDEDDINKKIINSYDIDMNVKSDKGYVKASQLHITQPYTIWNIKLENGLFLECADNHIIFNSDLSEVFVKNLKIGDDIYTENGDSKVISIKKSKYKISMMDMSIDSEDHRYYTNGILSHNTINSAITILYYCTFEKNKNILIAGNIAKTAEEILNKIKDIYYLLPFWIKPSVRVWNVSQITFGDTKCRIKMTATTKSAAIGNTIDLLYLDEFAHVPDNISEDFYKSIYPTVSAIKNSKIIITSTPKGYNLFWKLLDGAEKPLGVEGKNTFASKRVYWHQVPGRFVTYLRLNDYSVEKYGLTNEYVYEWVKNFGLEEETLDNRGFTEKAGLKMVINYENNKTEIHIPNNDNYLPNSIKLQLEDKEWENPLSDLFRTFVIEKEDIDKSGNKNTKRIKLIDLCDISSWKEDAITDIGSLESFNQEYDLQFLSGSKMVLDSYTMTSIEKSIFPFEYIDIPVINNKSFVPYHNMTWIKDREDLFKMENIKDYYLNFSVDISEGLNGDYSVINMFRLLIKPEEEWSSNITSLYDFFKLEQIGLFHDNRTSVQDLAELLYLLVFEICNENKIGVVIESNNWGGELTKTMRSIYNGRNKYSSYFLYRYKHRIDATNTDIGIKLRSNKNDFVKKYQKRVKQCDISIHHHGTLQEMTKFIKKESANGYTFQADSGAKDDIVMTVVEISSVFENVLFHDLVNRYMKELPSEIKSKIEQRLKLVPIPESIDYSSLFNATNKANNMRNMRNNNNSNDNKTSYGWGM
jgi:hypothetical protein